MMDNEVPILTPARRKYRMRQRTARPTNKVTAGAIADAIVILIVYVMQTAFGIDLPTLVQMALMLLIGAAAGYLTPPSDADIPDVVEE